MDGGQAAENFVQTIVAERAIAVLGGGARDFLHVLAIGDQLADLLGDDDEFVKGHAAAVAGLATVRTTSAAEK